MLELFVFIFGLIMGSFLNLLIYRLPKNISLLNPKRSICPKCNYQLKWYENIPLISYIFLKAKCSKCNNFISLIYPIVELFTATVTLFLFFKLGINIDFLIILILFYTLITLSFIDLKYKSVPDYLLLIALIVAFISSDFSFKNSLIFIGGIVLLEFFITFYIQNIKSRILNDDSLKTQKALGDGDIPIFAIIGGILGVKLGLFAIFLSTVFAIIPAIYNQIKKQEIETPFIPFLTLGLLVVYLFDDIVLKILGSIVL